MHDWNLPWGGACRCGRVKLRISAPPMITMACHCTGCQRMTASAFSLSVAIPADGFAVAEGEPVIGGLHGPTRHYFCPHCLSWMFTRPEGLDFMVNVRSTLLDQAPRLAPFVETYAAEKLPFAATGAAHSFATLPPIEAWEGLMRDYAAWVAR
jgi:hypothetical protein